MADSTYKINRLSGQIRGVAMEFRDEVVYKIWKSGKFLSYAELGRAIGKSDVAVKNMITVHANKLKAEEKK